MESVNKATHVGKEIDKLARESGSVSLMDQDNKDMLKKVKEQETNGDVIQTLLTDPQTGRSMTYAESRMRFG
jgi:hypothetical protein